ncbi:MAG: polysaccharide deacetylase family protein [Akkermansiaceae bacterium]|nr:polysaccharide deacetylase family protein [Akkermansiaceae bacterium]
MPKHIPFLLTGWIASSLLLHAQPAIDGADPETVDPKDDGVRVSVLGYHDFTTDEPETEMRIRADKFRRQMQLIRQLGITVISLEDFHAWKQGKKAIPEKSILITVDDGWKSFHEIAHPILKEFDYPYTLFLYKDYVDGGGRALTTPMIREMVKEGATIGSHSVSHPYPVAFKQQERKGEEAYLKFLRTEMGESKRFLERRFRTPITTYSYPGGYVTEEMLPLVSELGYDYAFTTQPGKVKRSDDNNALPRFMILGNYDRVFDFAVDYSEGGSPLTHSSLLEKPDFPVTPTAGMVIPDRLPTISVDLSAVENLDPDSLEMRVSGFTKVPASFDPETGLFSWQVNRPLRAPSCEINVTWRDLAGEPQEKPLRWGFQIDREAAYLDLREETQPTPQEP